MHTPSFWLETDKHNGMAAEWEQQAARGGQLEIGIVGEEGP